ncbi:hypothetical protein [Gallaecimonas sp. GXIMD4217]|uniref:hypothetical protein n=1 Tax=Gallaecimonas sp. GXIMD4217 TaxID=3131927 RepID=UPI00311B3E6A
MDDQARKALIDTSWTLHALVEESCLAHPAVEGDADWLEKQRILLGDMALHLLQTAINPGPVDLDKLRNNLNAILTISDRFLPEAELKKVTVNLYRIRD